MTLGPNWLTSWVKTNSKHVVYAPDKLEKNTFEKTSPTTASTANSSTGVDAVPRRDVDDARLSAVRNVGNRKNRRRMVKTRSVTDMIVEMANARNASNSDSETSVPKLTSATTKSDSSVATDTESTADLSPLQLVAGLFGASVDLDDDRMRPAQLPPYQPQTSKFINSKYLNEAAFILQREQKSLPLQQPKSHYAESSLVAERPTVAPRRSTRNEESFGSTKGHDSRPHVRGLANLKFLPQPFFGRADAEVQHTAYREPLESQLAAALDDLEYMRGVALSNEYTCQSCSIGETTNAAKPAALRSRGAASASLPEASKQLNEVISRHKKEVEQLTRERCRWQQDIHFKLNKFANLCKDLNEDSANRNEEAISLREDLETVKTERDSMSEELTRLRAQVQSQENQQAEYSETKKKLREYESIGLDRAEDAIQSRDLIISNLSFKLEQSLDLLELEREKQRQRRQIIFPSVKPPPTSCSSETLHC